MPKAREKGSPGEASGSTIADFLGCPLLGEECVQLGQEIESVAREACHAAAAQHMKPTAAAQPAGDGC